MSRLWLYGLGACVVAGGIFLGLSLIPEDPNRVIPGSQEPSSAEILDAVPEDEVARKSGLWTGPPEEHPAARLRKQRRERERLGISPRKRRSPNDLNRPLWEQEFGAGALVRAGYEAEEIERLKRQYEDARDKVLRELDLGPYGGASSPSRAEEAKAQDALASLIGESDDYDALLYATGQPNRLEIRQTTPLGRAHGLQPGDIFWEYDGNRIFPHDGYLDRMRADQARGYIAPVIFYREGQGFFERVMRQDKQGWGVVTRPVSEAPRQETAESG